MKLTKCDWNDNEVMGYGEDGKRYSVWCYVEFDNDYLPDEVEVDEKYAFEIDEYGYIVDERSTMLRIAHEAVDMVAGAGDTTATMDAQKTLRCAVAWLSEGEDGFKRELKSAKDALKANDAYDEEDGRVSWECMVTVKDFMDDATSWLFYVSDLV